MKGALERLRTFEPVINLTAKAIGLTISQWLLCFRADQVIE